MGTMSNSFAELTGSEQNALMTICILAAFADGALSESERGEIKRVAENSSGTGLDLGPAYQLALSGSADLASIASQLASADAKTLAYEMAVGVCDADQALNDGEKKFLERLRQLLQLPSQASAEFEQEASHLREEPPMISNTPAPAPAGLDEMIRDRAILAGALELMPQRLATMAIIPVQMRMVYQVGKAYGYELDVSHTKEFFATVGVGLTSQVVEGYLTRIVGNVAKRFVGRFGSMLATQATESAIAFATTYALGQAAKSYYGSGRTMSGGQLREVFSRMLNDGRAIQTRYTSEISQRAGSLKIADFVGR